MGEGRGPLKEGRSGFRGEYIDSRWPTLALGVSYSGLSACMCAQYRGRSRGSRGLQPPHQIIILSSSMHPNVSRLY